MGGGWLPTGLHRMFSLHSAGKTGRGPQVGNEFPPRCSLEAGAAALRFSPGVSGLSGACGRTGHPQPSAGQAGRQERPCLKPGIIRSHFLLSLILLSL